MGRVMLEANAIAVIRSGRRLLDDVSLSVAPGQVTAVLGENGAGKSTLLAALCGDLVPTSGQVTLNGRAVADYTPRERARLRALLPQDQQVAFGYTALEIALLGRYPHGDGTPNRADIDIARAAMDRVDALHLSQRSMATLSGGERARVHLARVLAQLLGDDTAASRFLLLDEPTASLDLAHQHLVLDLVRRFAEEERVGVVAVLHDFNLALQYADRALCLKRGRVLANGAMQAILTEELLARAFGMRCALLPNPHSKFPVVVPLGPSDPNLAAEAA
jgi:iron complex transport system ATP-binding protein